MQEAQAQQYVDNSYIPLEEQDPSTQANSTLLEMGTLVFLVAGAVAGALLPADQARPFLLSAVTCLAGYFRNNISPSWVNTRKLAGFCTAASGISTVVSIGIGISNHMSEDNHNGNSSPIVQSFGR